MVIFLVTGPLCSGKDIFAQVLKEKYDYKILKVTKCTFDNLWDRDKQEPVNGKKEEILKETLDLINLSLKNWHEDQVIYPVIFPESVEQITKKRSYFKVVGIDAPTEKRISTFVQEFPDWKDLTKAQFFKMDDYLNFELGVTECLTRAEFQISNTGTKDDMEKKIAKHDLITQKIFRPSWDLYFMKLAHVVRERSNCMRRSVGAIITQNNRIISTGYNGTPGPLKNCCDFGCKGCNDNLPQADMSKCNCIHAEENSVLECGVHNAKGATVYVTLAPCRWCTKILIQAQVSRVVYDEKYSLEGIHELFQKAGVQVDCVSIDI